MNLIKPILAIILSLTITLTSCNSAQSSSQNQKSAEELKMELKQQEQTQLTDYLCAEGTYKENFWGDKFNIKITITNKASIATFKDAIIRVTYFSKTNTELSSNDYTMYELFPPSSTKELELKINKEKDVNSISMSIISATPID